MPTPAATSSPPPDLEEGEKGGEPERPVELQGMEADDDWGKHPGMYSPPPPCVDPNERCGPLCACRPYCEESTFCRYLGTIGLKEKTLASWGLPRHRLMLVASVLTFIGWILCILAALGMSKNRNLIRDWPWATATSTGSADEEEIMYIGLSAAVVYTKSGKFVSKFLFDRHDDSNNCGSDDGFGFGGLETSDCEACQGASTSLQLGTLFSLFTQLTQLLTDVQRSTVAGDVNCQKFMGIATGLFGLLSSACTMVAFRKSCWGERFVSFAC